MAPTPKTQERKRKSTASANSSTPAKRRSTRGKDTVINLDEDPFNFENEANSHPEPLKNISIERTPFGGVKFSRSPPNASDRYTAVEKIAERRGNVSGTITTPTSSAIRPGSLSSVSGSSFNLQSSVNNSVISTPKSTGRKGRTPKSTKRVEEKEEESDDNVKEKDTSESVTKTPSSIKRSRASATDDNKTPKEKKLTLNDYCIVPKLTPENQLEVDHSGKDHKLLEAGARVMALWAPYYYAAIVCGRDGLSRYYIHFVEDNLNRQLPPNGVVSLTALSPGKQVSFITLDDDGQETGKEAEVVNSPPSDNPHQWVDGLFDLKADDGTIYKGIPWTKIFLTKEQHKLLNSLLVNTTVFVETENIVNESRSSRRSRSTRFDNLNTSAPSSEIATTPKVKTPKTPAVAKTPARKTPGKKTPKVVISSPDDEKPSTQLNTVSEEAAEGESNVAAEQQEVEDESAKSEEKLKQKDAISAEEPVIEEKKLNGSAMNINDKKEIATNSGARDVSFNDSAFSVDDTQELEEKNETKEDLHENDEVEEPMEVDTTATTAVAAGEENEAEKLESQSEPVVENNKSSESVSASQNSNGSTETAVSQSDVVLSSNNSSEPKLSSEISKLIDSNTAISISSISPPSTEEEANIFKNMKFVLTSATRSKKVSDFNKRDYRTKIEERGGKIIEDFSAIEDGDNAFLIADTYYRTHKYLSALSISVPCVKHYWILACVIEKKMVDHVPYMLPAGESSLDSQKIYEWKPLKHTLFNGKTVWVYSNVENKGDDRVISFVEIWSSIIKNLGANLVECPSSETLKKFDFISSEKIDILLTDNTCEKSVAERVEAEGGIVVSSEWVIQAIVTGELPDVRQSERFRFEAMA